MKDHTKQVTAIALITAFSVMGDSMLYIVLPIYWKWFGLTAIWQVGVLLSVNRLIRLPINPFIGWIYQKFDRKWILCISVLLAAFTTYSYGVFHHFTILLLARSFWGVSWSILRLGGFLAILDLSDDRSRGRLIGRYNGLWRLGSLVGMLAGGVFVDMFGVFAITLTFSVIALFGILFVWSAVPDGRGSQETPNTQNVESKAFWKNTYAIGVLATGLIISMVYMGILTSTLSQFIHQTGLEGMKVLGWTLASASISGGIQAIRWIWEPFMAPLFGKWSDGIRGRIPFLIIGCFGSGLLFFMTALPFGIPYWLICILLIQLGATLLTTLGDALASDAATQTSKVGLMTTYTIMVDLGASLGPSLAYLIIDFSSMNTAYGLTGLLLLLTGGGWLLHHLSKGKSMSRSMSQ